MDPLDAYSRAVTEVATAARSAVVAIRGHGARARTPAGTGSGFAFTPDGLILTNSHVVHGARRLEVETTDGGGFEADLLGEDPHSDTALLRVGANLSALPLGSSRTLRVGQPAISVGNPLGFDSSIT